MKHLISFSGGKDSTALILWGKENLKDFDVIFADTGWEHEITYAYVDYINQTLLDGKLITVKSKKYKNGFKDMAIAKKRAPSTKARFCTQELKLIPIRDYIQENYPDPENLEMCVGIRADESKARSKMKEKEFDTGYYLCNIHRPLLKWSANDVFNLMKKHGIKPNPLYKMGMKRVGCMPCIMSNQVDIRQIAKMFPEVIDEVRELEKAIGRTFFSADKIPAHARKSIDPATGVRIAFIDNVLEWVVCDPNQSAMFEEEPESCMSLYNICE